MAVRSPSILSILPGHLRTSKQSLWNDHDDEEGEAEFERFLFDGDEEVEEAGVGGGETRSIPTVLSSTVNLTNTILGTQMLSMPYAFSKLGPGLGTLLLLFFAILTRTSLRLLVRAAQKIPHHDTRSARLTQTDTPSYATLARAAFRNRWAAPVVDVMMAAACFGFAVSYLLMIAEGMPRIVWEVVPGWDGRGERVVEVLGNGRFWLFAFLLLLIPLSLSRDVDDFKWFSGTALACALYLACVVIYCYFTGEGIADTPRSGTPAQPALPERPWFIITDKALGVLPIFVFAFTCHQNMFAIYNELATAEDAVSSTSKPEITLEHIYMITDISVAVCFIMYVAVGWAGYFTFGDASDVVLLNNYSSIPSTTLARISFILLSAFSYPIQLHPCRAALDSVLTHIQSVTSHPTYQRLHSYTSLEPPRRHSPPTIASEKTTRRYLTTLLLLLTYTTVIFCDARILDKILVFLGSICGSGVCYVVPGMVFRRVDCNGVVKGEEEGGIRERALAYVVEIVGAACGCAGIIYCFMG